MGSGCDFGKRKQMVMSTLERAYGCGSTHHHEPLTIDFWVFTFYSVAKETQPPCPTKIGKESILMQ